MNTGNNPKDILPESTTRLDLDSGPNPRRSRSKNLVRLDSTQFVSDNMSDPGGRTLPDPGRISRRDLESGHPHRSRSKNLVGLDGTQFVGGSMSDPAKAEPELPLPDSMPVPFCVAHKVVIISFIIGITILAIILAVVVGTAQSR